MKRYKSSALLIAGIFVGTLLVAPASAHVSTSTWHLWTYHVKPAALGLFYTKSQSDTKYVAKTSLSSTGTLNSSANPVHWTKLRAVPGRFTDGLIAWGELTGVPGGFSDGVDNGLTSVNWTQLLGLPGFLTDDAVSWGELTSVPAGFADGTDDAGTGDVEGITAGDGLSGGGLSGNLVLALMECTIDDQVLKWSNSTGWGCAGDLEGLGDVTSVIAGIGISGGGASGAVTLDVDFAASGGDNGTAESAARSDHNHDSNYYSQAQADSRFFESYCKAAAANPYSYSAAPCMTTVRTLDSGGNVGEGASMAIGADGFPVMAYFDASNLDLKIIHCGDPACTAGNVLTAVDSAGSVGSDLDLAIGADGYPVISYRDLGNLDLKFAKCGSFDCSYGNTVSTVSTVGDVGRYSSVAIGGDGLPVITHTDNTNLDLRFVKCGDTACSSGNISFALDSDGNVGWYSSVAIGTDSLPVISYKDQTNGNLKVAKCDSADCSSYSSAVVDSSGDVGTSTSMTIGSDGFPIISYRDNSNIDLKVAKCANSSCTSADVTTVDSVGNVGGSTSVAIGLDGLPLISYEDEGNADLKLARCGNASCSAGNSVSTVDSAGNVGSYTSAVIALDGTPIVGYFASGPGDLKFARVGP